MSDERPDSPLRRIAPVPFYYCLDCNCNSCAHLLRRTFCPRCECRACIKDPKDPTYTPEHDESSTALGKRKQNSLTISPVKRVKADSINTVIKRLVYEAALSAASLPMPPNVGRFCLISLGHSAEDCLETCHIVPRALGEDDVLLSFALNLASAHFYLTSSKSSSLPGVFVTMASIFILDTT